MNGELEVLFGFRKNFKAYIPNTIQGIINNDDFVGWSRPYQLYRKNGDKRELCFHIHWTGSIGDVRENFFHEFCSTFYLLPKFYNRSSAKPFVKSNIVFEIDFPVIGQCGNWNDDVVFVNVRQGSKIPHRGSNLVWMVGLIPLKNALSLAGTFGSARLAAPSNSFLLLVIGNATCFSSVSVNFPCFMHKAQAM